MYRAVSNQVQAQQQQQQGQPKFKVLKALGRGSYGTVYKVQRLQDGQAYAMKETDIGKMSHQERTDAVNEIRVLGSLRHPNVVRQYEAFMAGNKLCIVMELAPAGDLAGFIRAASASGRPLPEGTVWQIFLQLCQGMQAVHDTCVIHRDIKPANIFMCPDNIVKVGDLGVAKALTRAHYAQTQIGTPIYMAPEVWRGLPYGYSSDLWSLGCVLYEMMSYRLPFDARSIKELQAKVVAGRFSPLAPGAYSAPLVGLCHALLSRDPRQRPTCAAVLNSPEAAGWMASVPAAVRLPPPPVAAGGGGGAGGGGALMPTIRVPKDLRLLPGVLPKPAYDATLRAAMIGKAHLFGEPAPAAAPSPLRPVAAAAPPPLRAPTPPGGPRRAGTPPQMRAPTPPPQAQQRAPSPAGFGRGGPSPAAARAASPGGGAAARPASPGFGMRAPSPRERVGGAPPLYAPQPPGAPRGPYAPAPRPQSGGGRPAGAGGAAALAAAGARAAPVGMPGYRPALGVLAGGAPAAAAAGAYRAGGAYAPKAPYAAAGAGGGGGGGAALGGRAGAGLFPGGPSPRGGRAFY
ncbi:MAG: kinase-like domain-containing protein [Monoraphidium minutum]|nr:MAG: kinase-like domain-containing protein [Monoraphidium minutum]